MKYHDKLAFIGFVDKDNNLQGIDSSSGGYPYTPTFADHIKLWLLGQQEEAQRYIETINYGGKGYRLVRVFISFGAL